MKQQHQPKVTLIRTTGTFARIPGNAANTINEEDTIKDPVGNGFWGLHHNFGPVLCFTMGPNKGMWIRRS